MNTILHYLVIGYGVTGRSIVNYLHRQGWQCTIYDDKKDSFTTYPPPTSAIQCVNNINALQPLCTYDEIFISPGIADEHPLLQQMAQLNIRGISDIDFFLRHAHGQIIAITRLKW